MANVDSTKRWSRRRFLGRHGVTSLALAGSCFAPVSGAEDQDHDDLSEYWQRKQKEYERLEEACRKSYGPLDAPPKYIYRGTDTFDRTPAFYAPLMEECRYLPEFQSVFTEGTAAQYFRYTMGFGMKDIIRFHGHSCEALYYTAAICRLICDKLFADGVVDRTLLRAMGGKSPCIGDSLAYITGGRLQFGTLNIEPDLGHAVIVQRIDNQGAKWAPFMEHPEKWGQ